MSRLARPPAGGVQQQNAQPHHRQFGRVRAAGGIHVLRSDFDGDRWSAASEALAYGMAGEVIGGPAGAPESGTPA